jgi:hypothetical protein
MGRMQAVNTHMTAARRTSRAITVTERSGLELVDDPFDPAECAVCRELQPSCASGA